MKIVYTSRTGNVETMVKKLVYSLGDLVNSVSSDGITVNVSFLTNN